MDQEPSPYEVSGSSVSPAVHAPPAMPSKVTKVFGIIHIIYAVLGMLSAIMGVVAMFALKAIVNQFDGQAKELDQIMKAYEGVVAYSYLDMGVKLALGVILLVAGIGLLRKKSWSIGASMFWAVSRIIVAVAMVFVMAEPTRVFQEEIKGIGGETNAQMQQMEQIIGTTGNIIGIIMVCAYPVLCMIFLSKKNVKQSLS